MLTRVVLPRLCLGVVVFWGSGTHLTSAKASALRQNANFFDATEQANPRLSGSFGSLRCMFEGAASSSVDPRPVLSGQVHHNGITLSAGCPMVGQAWEMR